MSLVLTKNQKRALRDLGEPWAYRVGWEYHGVLSYAEYRELLDLGLTAEAWTWASGNRPDVCITEAGAAYRETMGAES